MKKGIVWLGMVLIVSCMAAAAMGGYGGVWKPTDSGINFWISEHDTRSMTVIVSPDAVTFDAYLDPDYTDGFSASDLGGKGKSLSITFTSETEATAVLTPASGSPVTYTLHKNFGGAYGGFVFTTGGIFSDPQGLVYRMSAFSPYNIYKYTVPGGGDLQVVQDSVPRVFGDKLYIIGRFNSDTVTVLNTLQTEGNPVAQYSVGKDDPNGDLDIPTTQSSTNPHDIAFVSDSVAYMSFLGASAILKFNPATGERLALIDISAFSEGDDGLPEAHGMAKVGDFIYVILERLDRNQGWAPADGMVIKIDTTRDEVVDLDPSTDGVQGITLQRKNPGTIVYVPATQELFIQCAGSFSDTEIKSGIEVIDTTTDTSKGLRVKEETIGYVISYVAVSSDGKKGYLVGTNTSGDWPWPYYVTEFNPATGAVVNDKFLSVTYFIPAIALNNGCPLLLYVADRSDSDPGILVFDTRTDTQIGKADTLLPPQDLAVLAR